LRGERWNLIFSGKSRTLAPSGKSPACPINWQNGVHLTAKTIWNPYAISLIGFMYTGKPEAHDIEFNGNWDTWTFIEAIWGLYPDFEKHKEEAELAIKERIAALKELR
jgi:hypothetical protein